MIKVEHANKTFSGKYGTVHALQDVSIHVEKGDIYGIIGFSGAGKSTLIRLVNGLETPDTGNVIVQGENLGNLKKTQLRKLRRKIGMVFQQFNLLESKTVYHNIALPLILEKAPKEEIDKKVKEVLRFVELEDKKDVYVSQLSGGQKKRASIAVELLADPKLFFLDEPTSGLDPGTEKNLMMTLSKLSKEQNKTIVMVTHTTQNLHLCDKIIFMGPGGRLCFCGNVEEAKKFYQTDDLVNIYNMIAENPELWQRKFEQSRDRSEISGRRGSMDETQSREIAKKNKGTSGFRQFGILTGRYAELLWNDRQRLALLLIQPLLIAILLKIVADKDIFKIYESTKSMLFALSCSGIWIGMFNSIQEICKERVILKREYMSNLKLPCYMMSKFVLQALLGLIQSIILTLVFLSLVGNSKKGIFFSDFRPEMLFTVWLTVIASVAMGFIISSVVQSGDKAMAAAPFVLIVQLLFSGILFTLKGAGKIISYCTVSRWSVEALGSIARLNKLDLRMQADFPMLEHEAESFFKATAGHVWTASGILILMTAVLMVVATLLLRNVAKDRR